MHKKDLTVLLIEDSSSYAELVQHWLSNAGEETKFTLNWTDSLVAGMTRLAQGGVDAILLDLTLPESSGLETYTRVRAQAPRTPIIILSSADSESLALQMIQEGAEDYLVKSACDAGSLARALRYAVLRHRSQRKPSAADAPGRSRVVGVMGAKGGVGATTIACTLAAALREQTSQKVLLADLDSCGGLTSFLTGAESGYSLADAVANLHRMDASCWETIISEGPNGLDVIGAPNQPMEAAELPADQLRQVLGFAEPLYGWTVLDLGRLHKTSAPILDSASDVFVVTTLAVPSLYSAKRLIDTLTATLDAGKIRLIVNQIEESHPLSRTELDSMFGIPVYAVIPSDRDRLHEACVRRSLPGKDSKIHRGIARLARKLTGVPEPRKRSMPSILSFANFRKVATGTPVAKVG